MLFVYFPALLPLTQVRNRNINKGDRKDADTAEGGPNRINRVPGKDSYLIDAITDVAIGNSRVKNKQNTRMQLTGLVNMIKKRAIIYMLQAKVVPFMMDYKLISPLPASGWRRTR